MSSCPAPGGEIFNKKLSKKIDTDIHNLACDRAGTHKGQRKCVSFECHRAPADKRESKKTQTER